MLFNEIYGISGETPLPWWIERNPLLAWLVYNPIFQLHMKKKYKPPIVDGFKGFIAGILYLIAIFIVYRINNEDPEVGSRYFISLFLLPTSILFAAGFIRAALLCLVTAPSDMRREIETLRLNAVMTTPISDAAIYFCNACQVIFRTLAANVGTLVFIITLTVPSMIVISANQWDLLEHFLFTGSADGGTILVVMLLMFFNCTLYLYLISFAGTLYAIELAAFPATIATVAHVGLTLFFMLLVSLIANATVLRGSDMFMLSWNAVIVWGINTLLLLLITWLTGQLGVIFFARYRRPGFFEPEYATASGLR